MSNLNARIDAALQSVKNPRTGADVLSAEMVRDIATTTDGRVRLALYLDPADDATLVREVRQAIEGIEGVQEVRVDVKPKSEMKGPGHVPPAASGAGRPAAPAGAPRALPVMDDRPQAGRVPAPQPKPYPHLGKIIAVSSGKGGVGKSTVSTNLAVALAKAGKRVGLMDADVYGPNLPRMMGIEGAPPVLNEKIVPLSAHGVKVISLGLLIDRDQPAIWRGPIVMKIVTQFLQDVAWGELDYFIVDMPPGTGDAQLSLVQATPVTAAIIVTTPQEVSVGDALRGVKMFERVGVPVWGIVENMSWFECPHCGKPSSLFGTGGGERLAKEVGVPLLGQIPLYPRVMEAGDAGTPIVVSDAGSSAAKALTAIAEKVAAL
ncbi:MAG TPA: Mrp/NBP35 family ATP-binding protein [Gemmatimonadaceae bacterium]